MPISQYPLYWCLIGSNRKLAQSPKAPVNPKGKNRIVNHSGCGSAGSPLDNAPSGPLTALNATKVIAALLYGFRFAGVAYSNGSGSIPIVYRFGPARSISIDCQQSDLLDPQRPQDSAPQ
jgi:hypothetical protein